MPTREELFQDMERERVKKLKLLEATFEMHENSKKDVERKLRKKLNPDGTAMYSQDRIKKQLELVQGMQDEVVTEYQQLGGDVSKLDAIAKKKKVSPDKKEKNKDGEIILPIYDRSDLNEYLKTRNNDNDKVKEMVYERPTINTNRSITKNNEAKTTPITTGPIIVEKKQDETSWLNSEVNNTSFDVIPLPSNGQCYPSKKDRIPVAYLTAYDENIIVSPNLYRDNKVLDYVIKNKVMNNAIDPDDLVVGDRDAIILWLRATGYGNMYPVRATDNETGKDFETLVDLSQIKFKPFTLIGDENGWFEFETPLKHDKIKFRYLTARDIKVLEELEKDEERRSAAARLKNITEDIQKVIDFDTSLDKNQKVKIFDAQDVLSDWAEELEASETDNKLFNSTVTNRMELMFCSVNGNTDRQFIHDFINSMNVRDAAAFRRYALTNEPGLDYNITIERPESIGGGSVNLFLQLDQLIFLNLPE